MSEESRSQKFTGTSVAEGYAVGRARVVDVAHFPTQVPRHTVPEDDLNAEVKRLRNACSEAREDLEGLADRLEEEVSRREADLLRPQAAMAEDPTFIAEAEELIIEENVNAEAAVAEVIERFEQMMDSLEDEYLRERSADVRDVGRRILAKLLFVEGEITPELASPCVVVSSHLVPSLTVHLDRENILAFATEKGGYTSHAAILARSLGIPAVTGLEGLTDSLVGCETMIVDGQKGVAIVEPEEDELDRYRNKAEQYNLRIERLEGEAAQPAVTEDDSVITIRGNIGRPGDLSVAVENSADGIGLYRTEFNYLSRSTLPPEQEIFEEYRDAVKAFPEEGVVLRLLDIGGDKFPPSIPLAHEENPFLGLRGIRLMLEHKTDLMLPQLRAIMRASEFGKVDVLYPMVTSVEEVTEANKVFEEALSQLQEQGCEVGGGIRKGIMIEVPSCLPILPELLEECDFATVGTNDLVQYSMAADRNSERMVDIYDAYYPSIVRQLRQIVDTARECDTEVSVCGETASDLYYLPILMGLGYEKFSVNLHAIGQIRHLIRNISISDCRDLAGRALEATTRHEIHRLANGFR
ncbi:MAG: phosphoenolpyruvate--protein phosphotransferase [Candidatus Brocadiia bacterium]